MYTIAISILSSLAIGIGIYYTTYSYALSVIVALILMLIFNYFIGKYFLKKLTALFQMVEKDLKAGRTDKAIERLNEGYSISKWQLYVKEQINAQIGIIYYSNKKFDTARPYLEKAFTKNWMAMCMKAALYFKENKMEEVKKIMEKAIKGAPKEGFVYALYAYFLVESGDKQKAVEILNKGVKKNPLDERLGALLTAVQNNKKLKMQNYGTLWLQMHLTKTPQGAKQYQQFLMNQRMKRR
jgi:predicted Zn-dependent protease